MCMKYQEECEKDYLASGGAEDTEESDSEDDTAYINNTEDSVFLANKMKDSSINSAQKPTIKGKKSKSSKSYEKEISENDTKNGTVNHQDKDE